MLLNEWQEGITDAQNLKWETERRGIAEKCSMRLEEERFQRKGSVGEQR